MTDIQRKILLTLGSLALAVIILCCALIAPQAEATSTSEYYENAVLFWTNAERVRAGKSELLTTAQLQNVADVRAKEIVTRFDHTRPNGTKWSTLFDTYGIDYNDAGENLAASKDAPYVTVYNWMNSEAHRKNILAEKFSYVGCGYYYDGSATYKHYWSQEFAGGIEYANAAKGFYVAPTGLSADKSTLELAVGASGTVSGIPTPVYATEEISCVSSNTAVVRVDKVTVNVISVTGVNHGTAELTLRCGKYTETVTVKVGTGINSDVPFVDVSPNSVYYKAVVWAYKNEIVSGTDTTHFSPKSPCTRGQVVTFLWRAAGKPTVDTANPFVDVKEGSYCDMAVRWAVKYGVTSGTDATHFSPNATVTREQFVTLLWNYRGKPVVSIENPFVDVPNKYYYNAIMWAYSTGVTSGVDATHFGVGRPCERYQVAMFIYNDMT